MNTKPKNLLFEEEQKKRAAKRASALGNLQNAGVSAAPQPSAESVTKAAAQSGIIQTKSASPVGSSKQNAGGGIIEMQPGAFSLSTRTANTAAGMVKSDSSNTVRMQSADSTGNLQKPRRTPDMTRSEAWGMLENERKDKSSFSVPNRFSEQGKDVFLQLMELPDWGLDGSGSKKDEKVVALKRTIRDVVPEKGVRRDVTPFVAPNVTNPLRMLGTITEKRSEKEEEIAENAKVMRKLNDILDEQYPLSNDYVPFAGSVANYRLQDAVREIHSNKDVIKKASEDYSVPAEMIAAVILKERYTQSAPDAIVVALDAIFGRMGSTGLGAVQRNTARDAGEYIDPAIAATLPENDVMLATKLWLDDEFNIRTIAAVLRYRAEEVGIDLSKESLTDEEIFKLLRTITEDTTRELSEKIWKNMVDIRCDMFRICPNF